MGKKLGYRWLALVLCLVLVMPGCTRRLPENVELKLSEKSITLETGGKQKLTLVDEEGNSDYMAEWSSSDPNVATVRSTGTVTGISEGTARITAEYRDEEYTCEVTVKKPEGLDTGADSGRTGNTLSAGTGDGRTGNTLSDGAGDDADDLYHKEKKFRLWCVATEDSSEFPGYEKAIAELAEDYPWIELEWTTTDVESYKTKIKSAVANNELPDIFYTWTNSFLRDLVNSGKVYCVDDIYRQYSNQLPAAMMESSALDGKYYSIPYAYYSTVLFANMDVLNSVGVTEVPQGQEFFELEQKLMEAGISPYGCALSEAWCAAEFVETLLISRMGHADLNNIFMRRSSWDNSNVKLVLSELQNNLVQNKQSNYFYPNSAVYTNEEIKNAFLNDEFAFYINGNWNCPDFSYFGGDKIRAAVYPCEGTQESGFQRSGGPSYGFAISNQCEYPEYAAEYAFELAKRLSRYIYLDRSALPAWNIDYDDSVIDPLMKSVADLGFETTGFTVFGDTAMDSLAANTYLSCIYSFFADMMDWSEFIDQMTSNVSTDYQSSDIVFSDTSLGTAGDGDTSRGTAGNGERRKLTLWCIATEYDVEHNAYLKAIEELQKLYPDVDLEWEAIENESFKYKIRAAAAAGNDLPDIFFVWNASFLREFVDAGAVYCLDDTYRKYSALLPETMIEASTIYGNRYAVPYACNYSTMFANTEVLKASGINDISEIYTNLYQVENSISQAGFPVYGCALKEVWCASEFLETMMLNYGGHKLMNDIFFRDGSWGDEDIYWSGLDFDGIINSSLMLENAKDMYNDEVIESFLNDEFAFYINGTWNLNSFEQRGNEKIQLAPYPNKSDVESGTLLLGGPSGGLAVSAYSENASLAAEYAFELAKLLSRNLYLEQTMLPCWIPDYDVFGVSPMYRAAAETGLAASGFTLWGDNAMDEERTYKYISLLGDYIYGILPFEDFRTALYEEVGN